MDTNEVGFVIIRDKKEREIKALREWIKNIQYVVEEGVFKHCGRKSYSGLSTEKQMEISYYCEQALEGKFIGH